MGNPATIIGRIVPDSAVVDPEDAQTVDPATFFGVWVGGFSRAIFYGHVINCQVAGGTDIENPNSTIAGDGEAPAFDGDDGIDPCWCAAQRDGCRRSCQLG